MQVGILDGSLRQISWVLVAAPLLGCYGGEGEQESEELTEPEALVSDCRLETTEAACERICHLTSGEAVKGQCVSVGGEMPFSCRCEGGPSDGRFFALSSCDDLEASIASVCTETSPTPACPSLLPASGQACSHRQTCLIEEFSGDCSPGEAVRKRSLEFDCIEGVWQEIGVGEDFCP